MSFLLDRDSLYLADALGLLGRSVVYGIASGSTDEARDNNELF